MSGKKKSGSARAVPRAYGRLTRHERDTVQRMLERRASCREIARELGRSPSTVSAEVASHRFVTAPKARRGERVDASADLSAACPRLAAWPRCCNGCGRYRAIGCKRRPHVFYEARAAQLCADSVLVSSRRGDRRRRARRGGQAGGDKGLPAPGAVARADGGAQRRPGGPVAVDHLPLGLGGLRRHDQHGAQAQGRLQAEEARRGPGGDPPLRPQVACRVPRPRGGRVRRGLGDGHRRGGPGGLRLPAHAAAPPQQAPARAAAGGEDRRVRRGRPGGRPGHPRRRRDAPRVPRRPHRQRRRVLRRGGDRGAARRGAGRDEAVLLRPQAQRPEGRLRAQPRRDQEAAAQGRRNQVRPARPGRPGAGHVARELRAPRRARLRDARARLQGDARGGRGGAAGRLRRGGRAHRGTRPDAGAHREGARREGRCPRWPSLGRKTE